MMNLYFKVWILGYCGIKLEKFKLFWKMREKNEEERRKILKSI